MQSNAHQDRRPRVVHRGRRQRRVLADADGVRDCAASSGGLLQAIFDQAQCPMFVTDRQVEHNGQVASSAGYLRPECHRGRIALQAGLEPAAELPLPLLEVALVLHPNIEGDTIESDTARRHALQLLQHAPPVQDRALRLHLVAHDVVAAELRVAQGLLQQHHLCCAPFRTTGAPLTDVRPSVQHCAASDGQTINEITSQTLHGEIPVPGNTVVSIDLKNARLLRDRNPGFLALDDVRGELGALLRPLLLLGDHAVHRQRRELAHPAGELFLNQQLQPGGSDGLERYHRRRPEAVHKNSGQAILLAVHGPVVVPSRKGPAAHRQGFPQTAPQELLRDIGPCFQAPHPAHDDRGLAIQHTNAEAIAVSIRDVHHCACFVHSEVGDVRDLIAVDPRMPQVEANLPGQLRLQMHDWAAPTAREATATTDTATRSSDVRVLRSNGAAATAAAAGPPCLDTGSESSGLHDSRSRLMAPNQEAPHVETPG
mmetsp:Transcript_54289/g.156089  ORF Transcript_54289/g.156089 Transcript_54289/m.156089 type:complete len:484 (+) Transcript_54289:207-1658(+)